MIDRIREGKVCKDVICRPKEVTVKGMLRWLCLILLAGSVSFAAEPGEETRQQAEVSRRMMTYFRSPSPDKIAAMLQALDAAAIDRRGFSPVLGFFYEVFRANPARVPGWLRIIAKFRQPDLKLALQSVAVIASPECRPQTAGVQAKLPSPEEFDRLSAADPDLCWGRFFATGAAEQVDRVLRRALRAKDQDDTIDLIAFAAQWSLFALSRQMPEVEKILRELLAKLSDDDVAFLFGSVKQPERERLLGKERAAKLPPPVEKSFRVQRQNPFKGLFQEWKDRPDPTQETRRLLDVYIAELIRMYPDSSADDIRKFMVWFWLGAKDHAAGMKNAPCADSWAEALRISQLYAASQNNAAYRANRELIRRLPQGDLLRMELVYVLRVSEKDRERRKRFVRELIDEIESVVRRGQYHNAYFYRRLYNLLDGNRGSRYWIELEARLKPHAKEIDPWFWEMVQGRAGIAAAWEGRGIGWASTVTKEGWNVFEENLDKARRHLKRAIELFPDRYEAHILMISVEMGACNFSAMVDAYKKCAWYNAAHCDAFRKILWGLQPRWGGSFELMKMLAVEAMKCPRRDVGVAELGYQALANIAKYSDMRWRNVYRDPEVRKLGDRLFAEYEQNLKTPEERHIFLLLKFCRQMVLGEYDEAAATFREYGGAECAAKERWWQWEFFIQTRIGTPMYDDPVVRLKVFTGSHAAELRAAEDLFLNGDDDAAAEKLAAIIRDGKLPPDEKTFLIDLYGRWRLDCPPYKLCLDNGNYRSSYLVALRDERSDVAEEMVKLGYRQKEEYPGEIIFNIVKAGDNTDEIVRRHAAGEDIDVVLKVDGWAPLHSAAYFGHAAMADTLLKCGAKIDRRNHTGHTPLHIAAARKRGPVIRVLFVHGADPNEQDNEGDFCLLYLPQVHALPGLYRIFLEHPKINVNLRNHAGETALHYMAKSGTPVQIFKLMIDAGADCNIRDNGGRTPLDVAESSSHTRAAEFLRSVGGKRGAELPPVKPLSVRKDTTPPPQPSEPPKYWYWGFGVLPLLIALLFLLRRKHPIS